MSRVLDRAYRRLGDRYPMAALAAALRLEYIIVAAGAGAALALYVEVSFGESALLAAAAVAVQEFYAQLTQLHFSRRLTALSAWLQGQRGEHSTVAAWRSRPRCPSSYCGSGGAAAIR